MSAFSTASATVRYLQVAGDAAYLAVDAWRLQTHRRVDAQR